MYWIKMVVQYVNVNQILVSLHLVLRHPRTCVLSHNIESSMVSSVHGVTRLYHANQIKSHQGRHHHHQRRHHCHQPQQNHHKRNALQTHYLTPNVINTLESVLMILTVKDTRSVVDTGVTINVSILCKI